MGAQISVITKLNAWLALLVGMVVSMAGIALYVQDPSGDRQTLAITLGVLVLFTTVAGVGLRMSVRNGILRSIRDAAHVVTRVADGDLTARVTVSSHGETQRMLEGLERMTRELRALVGGVTQAANTVATSSAQIAQGNLDLSQRTEEQASTLEETASSMEELTSTVAQNAENARQASPLAGEASDVARRGGHVVGQVVSTMSGISDSSRKIADIIGVIDGIAFQTNILALNAAVEAARAGDQGRGFAVVASEVRSLVQRSAAAAKEIKALIGDSVARVETGTRQVDAAGKTMDEIVDSVSKVSTLIAEIAAASREQSAGIHQVNSAVAQMEQVVQQNASLVEEASAATESMRDQAEGLLQAVARFRVGEEASSRRTEPTPVRPMAPIKVKPVGGGAVPTARTANLNGARGQRPALGSSGQWEEF